MQRNLFITFFCFIILAFIYHKNSSVTSIKNISDKTVFSISDKQKTIIKNSSKKIEENLLVIAKCINPLNSKETDCQSAPLKPDEYNDPNLTEDHHKLADKLIEIREAIYDDKFKLHKLDNDSLIAAISIDNPNINFVALDLVTQKKLRSREKKAIIRASQRLSGKNYIQITSLLLKNEQFSKHQKHIYKGLREYINSNDLHTSIEILRKLPYLKLSDHRKVALTKSSCHHVFESEIKEQSRRLKRLINKVGQRISKDNTKYCTNNSN